MGMFFNHKLFNERNAFRAVYDGILFSLNNHLVVKSPFILPFMTHGSLLPIPNDLKINRIWTVLLAGHGFATKLIDGSPVGVAQFLADTT